MVIRDTEALIEKIVDQTITLKANAKRANDALSKVTPQTKEQRQKYQIIYDQISTAERKFESVIQNMKYEVKDKEILDQRHAESEETVKEVSMVGKDKNAAL